MADTLSGSTPTPAPPRGEVEITSMDGRTIEESELWPSTVSGPNDRTRQITTRRHGQRWPISSFRRARDVPKSPPCIGFKPPPIPSELSDVWGRESQDHCPIRPGTFGNGTGTPAWDAGGRS